MVNSVAIKQRAKEKDIRQKEMARAMGVKQPTANQKINNIRPMLLEEAEKLAQLLGISDEEFRFYFFV